MIERPKSAPLSIEGGPLAPATHSSDDCNSFVSSILRTIMMMIIVMTTMLKVIMMKLMMLHWWPVELFAGARCVRLLWEPGWHQDGHTDSPWTAGSSNIFHFHCTVQCTHTVYLFKWSLQESQSLVDIATHPLLAATSSVDRLTDAKSLQDSLMIMALVGHLVVDLLNFGFTWTFPAIAAAAEVEEVKDFFQKSRDKLMIPFFMRRALGWSQNSPH